MRDCTVECWIEVEKKAEMDNLLPSAVVELHAWLSLHRKWRPKAEWASGAWTRRVEAHGAREAEAEGMGGGRREEATAESKADGSNFLADGKFPSVGVAGHCP